MKTNAQPELEHTHIYKQDFLASSDQNESSSEIFWCSLPRCCGRDLPWRCKMKRNWTTGSCGDHTFLILQIEAAVDKDKTEWKRWNLMMKMWKSAFNKYPLKEQLHFPEGDISEIPTGKSEQNNRLKSPWRSSSSTSCSSRKPCLSNDCPISC